MEFRVLGPLQVLDEGESLPLGGAKQRSTLAMLLLARNQVVSRDRLIEGLWGASPPPTAAATLDTYLSRVRRLLPGAGDAARLVTEPPGYRLRVEVGELDLERFETLLDRARTARASGDARTAARDLREALGMFRGTPLEDLVHAPFAQAEIGPLEELRLVALERRLEADLADGRDAELVGELEALTARHPFRETLWAELMLALYRAGRQVAALEAFDRARRILAEQFGLEPGRALKQLQSQILRQDPSLTPGEAVHAGATASGEAARGADASRDQTRSRPVRAPPLAPPATPAARDEDGARRNSSRGARWPVALVVMATLAAALAVVVVPRVVGGREEVRGEYRLGTVLIDLSTGDQIESIPLSRLPVSAYPVFADGHFWVNNWSPFEYVEIDARSGTILRSMNAPARDPDVHEEGRSITPFVVEGDVMWVTSADDLVKMDIGLGREVDRFRLDALGQGAGVAEGVAVGAGSVWVSRDVGLGQILRLDPVSGTPEHVWNDVSPSLNLKFGDGALWVADERGLARIDAQTNLLRRVSGIQGNCGRGVGGCVAAGGGSGWTSHINKGEVFKVDEAGQIAATHSIGIGSGWLSFADGVLWVGNLDEGTVTGIDGVTGATTHTYRFDHPVGPIAAGDGVLLVSLFPGPTVADRLASLEGRVAKFFSHAGELGGDEPALNVDPGAYQIQFATCAKLLNYPDKPPPEGLRLAPEIAAGMPTISRDGRTYTFTVRPGYRFSPPSNQPVTAETFRHSIERALSPRLAHNPIGQIPPGPLAIDDIQGERAFRDGAATHISGLRARGDTLSITLVRPSPDFLERLALPFFCPVPDGTPSVAGAARATKAASGGRIPFNGPYSAGPYFVADYDSDAGYVVLKRNPNYHGPRPHSLDAIAIREGVDATAALDLVQRHEWDGITSLSDPLLDPGKAVDQRWGARSPAARRGDRRYFTTPAARTRFIAFNATRGIFADPAARRAAALALDRTALAATWGKLPTDQLLSAALPAYRDRRVYPLHASVARARAIARRRTGRAVMAIPVHCDRCTEAAHLVRRDLSAIDVDVKIRTVADLDRALRRGATFDLVDGETEILYPDSASFLARTIQDIPRGWVQPALRKDVERVARLTGADRQTAAAALAERLTVRHANVVAYGAHHTIQFINPRIRCRVLTPAAYGLDLAAQCLNG